MQVPAAQRESSFTQGRIHAPVVAPDLLWAPPLLLKESHLPSISGTPDPLPQRLAKQAEELPGSSSVVPPVYTHLPVLSQLNTSSTPESPDTGLSHPNLTQNFLFQKKKKKQEGASFPTIVCKWAHAKNSFQDSEGHPRTFHHICSTPKSKFYDANPFAQSPV